MFENTQSDIIVPDVPHIAPIPSDLSKSPTPNWSPTPPSVHQDTRAPPGTAVDDTAHSEGQYTSVASSSTLPSSADTMGWRNYSKQPKRVTGRQETLSILVACTLTKMHHTGGCMPKNGSRSRRTRTRLPQTSMCFGAACPRTRGRYVCDIFSQLIYLTRFQAAEKQAKENNAAEKKGKGKGKEKEKAGHDLLFHSTALIPSWFFLRPRSSEQIPPATTDVTRSRIDCTISPPVLPPPSSALN